MYIAALPPGRAAFVRLGAAMTFVLRLRRVDTGELLELRPDGEGIVSVPSGMFEAIPGAPIPAGVRIVSARSRLMLSKDDERQARTTDQVPR